MYIAFTTYLEVDSNTTSEKSKYQSEKNMVSLIESKSFISCS